AQALDGEGFNRPRRRRSRNRKGGGGSGRPMPGDVGGTQAPVDIPPGEQVTVSGVLFLKNNGSGLLVQPSNNYVPQATDALVPRSMIERLHLQPGLLLAGGARRGGNGGLELVGLETVEGMTLEEYRESRHPFSELISIDPHDMFKLET